MFTQALRRLYQCAYTSSSVVKPSGGCTSVLTSSSVVKPTGGSVDLLTRAVLTSPPVAMSHRLAGVL